MSSSQLASLIPFLPTYGHLIFASLIPIFAGSHASLRRPFNTLSPEEVKILRPTGETSTEEEDDENNNEASTPIPETLTAQDAMMFPVMAGVSLGGLYLIIKWLDDPQLLSRILTWYFCAMGVFGVGRAFSDLLGVAVEYTLPHRFTDSKGNLHEAGFDSWKVEGSDQEHTNPIPNIELPPALHKYVWMARRTLRARYVIDMSLYNVSVFRKSNAFIGDFFGPVIGLFVVGMYAAGGKHWLLTNIMGISFSYGAIQLLSPATFPIATLLLGLLFFYDIFFVFYTPLMVTVATTLDVPIKLLFPRPGKLDDGSRALAMLGLGDIVLPGIFIAMALRYDLWRFYEIKHLGFWDSVSIGSFPKTYFNASMVGYVVGMVTTLVVMHVFKHAQPALLYLVPGVLSAVWGTAAAKGELSTMWNYTEEGEIEEEKDEKKKDTEKDEKKDEKEKEEVKVKGEVDQDILRVKIIRRPAIGARLPQEPSSTPTTNSEAVDDEEGALSEDYDNSVYSMSD
ncbi:signal peptide peptidase-domain-containing protein [Pyronema omphalodes]|nr:signal peptide peptidase-domain-containing protein [Pyronema omphalodes]